MAMDVGGAKGGIKSDINVTPLVDVMLVLLIIMMIVAPMLNQGVMLTLPSATNTTDKPDTQDQIVVFVDANSKLYVNAVESAEADVIAKITAALDKSKERVVYLKGDKDAPYSAIMKMMDALRGAQVDTVGLITERPGVNDDKKKGGQLMSRAHQHHGAEKVVKGTLPQTSADMNVTPLIDVLLVLLVIFMATLPLTQKGVDINLPLEVSNAPKQADILNQIVAEYTADRRLMVNKQETPIADAETKFRDIFETRKDKTLFLIGAGAARYGDIMNVIDAAMGAGVTKIGVVTDGMRQEAANAGAAVKK